MKSELVDPEIRSKRRKIGTFKRFRRCDDEARRGLARSGLDRRCIRSIYTIQKLQIVASHVPLRVNRIDPLLPSIDRIFFPLVDSPLPAKASEQRKERKEESREKRKKKKKKNGEKNGKKGSRYYPRIITVVSSRFTVRIGRKTRFSRILPAVHLGSRFRAIESRRCRLSSDRVAI